MSRAAAQSRKLIVGAAMLAALAPPLAGEAHAQAQASPYTSGARYDALRRVTGTIGADPDGAGPRPHLAVRNSYDAAGRLVRVESGTLTAWQSEAVAPAGWTGFDILQTTDIVYDAMGRKLRETVTAGGAVHSLTQHSYDALGRLDCTAVRMNPAAFGSLPAACTLGAEGSHGPDRIVRNAYDAAGQLLQVQRAYGTPLQQNYVTYSYTLNGQRASVTDANGNRAELRYDGYDRQARWVFPHPGTTGAVNEADYEAYDYDAAGNRTSLRKRDGTTIAFHYDALNRLQIKSVPQSASGAPGYAVHYGYDLRGLQTYARFGSPNGEGVLSGYDAFGRMTVSWTIIGGIGSSVSSTWDAAGNRDSLSTDSGYWLGFVHDQTGRMTAIQEGGPNMVAGIAYDGAGRRTSLQLGSGGAFPSSGGYGYDPIGRLGTLTRDLAGTTHDQSLGFSYNAASQVVQRTSSNDAYVSNTAYDVSRNYAVNGLNQYTAAGPATFSYDLNGNLTSDGSTNYVYDAENRLVSASGTTNATLSYDPLGRLRLVTSASGTRRYVYDGDNLIEEYDGAGTRLRVYAHGPSADEPLVWYELTGGTMRRFLHADHQGSIIAVADESGNALAINAYDAWGIPNATNQGRFGYTGQTWIPELGLWHYKARVYSPTLGRFLQTDPVGYDDQINLYAYVWNDPVNGVDPTGTSCESRPGSRICEDTATRIVGTNEEGTIAYTLTYFTRTGEVIRTGSLQTGRANDVAVGPVEALAGGFGILRSFAGRLVGSSRSAGGALVIHTRRGFTQAESAGLRRLMGQGAGDAERFLSRVANGAITSLPRGVTRDTLNRYVLAVISRPGAISASSQQMRVQGVLLLLERLH